MQRRSDGHLSQCTARHSATSFHLSNEVVVAFGVNTAYMQTACLLPMQSNRPLRFSRSCFWELLSYNAVSFFTTGAVACTDFPSSQLESLRTPGKNCHHMLTGCGTLGKFVDSRYISFPTEMLMDIVHCILMAEEGV